MASKGSKQEDGFEALYQQLEQTVVRLEQGNLTLEESLAQYEAGMKLARRCQELLQKAELRVTTLQEQFSEGLAPLREELEAYEAEAEPEPVFEEEEGA